MFYKQKIIRPKKYIWSILLTYLSYQNLCCRPFFLIFAISGFVNIFTKINNQKGIMKNILITGGAGFIGSKLSLHLLDKGYNVTILDIFLNKFMVIQKLYLYGLTKEEVNFILGDVCNISDWRLAIKNQNAVIHLAAETGTGQSMYELLDTIKLML